LESWYSVDVVGEMMSEDKSKDAIIMLLIYCTVKPAWFGFLKLVWSWWFAPMIFTSYRLKPNQFQYCGLVGQDLGY
jgi:hypothetical protein